MQKNKKKSAENFYLGSFSRTPPIHAVDPSTPSICFNSHCVHELFMIPQNVNRFDNDDVVITGFISLSLLFPLLCSDVSPNQMHQVTLDPVEQVKLTWMVDWPEKNVFFQVKNGINEKYSWFAIGFSRRGEFPRTDFCIFQRETDRIDINIVSHKSSFFYIVRPLSFYKLETVKSYNNSGSETAFLAMVCYSFNRPDTVCPNIKHKQSLSQFLLFLLIFI